MSSTMESPLAVPVLPSESSSEQVETALKENNGVGVLNGAKEADATRVLRYDEVWDYRTYSSKLVRTAKKHNKVKQKKAMLIVRRCFNNKHQHTSTKVDIKSQVLVDALLECNRGVIGLHLNKTPPCANTHLFYHSRHALAKFLEEEKAKVIPDPVIVGDLHEAVKFIEEEHEEAIDDMKTLQAHNEITWELLWALFKPSSLVYHFSQYVQQPQLLLFRQMEQRQRQGGVLYWNITCDIVVDDGVRFGLAIESVRIEIDKFEGARKISNLTIIPIHKTEGESELRRDLAARGRSYAGLSKATYWETHGPTLAEDRTPENEVKWFSFEATGRTMIDAASFKSFNPNCKYVPTVHTILDREKLTEEQYLVCSPYALGFCFGTKKWGGFAVSRLHEVLWSGEAFRTLVLEKKRKTLVHSLIRQHSANPAQYDDLVKGKGKGLVMLLSGNPGCGKTLTAEAVAEVTEKPLYSITAGELGITPDSVDKALSLALDLAHRWQAVMLLDEADVFLQKRDSANLDRNALVSIFLRQLEYYQGILILTTNRIADFDPAFESRIHVSLDYPDLNIDARRKIWKTFLRKSQQEQTSSKALTKDELDTLAAHVLNGRQIRNVIGSAGSIARENGEMLDLSHIDIVMDVRVAWNALRKG